MAFLRLNRWMTVVFAASLLLVNARATATQQLLDRIEIGWTWFYIADAPLEETDETIRRAIRKHGSAGRCSASARGYLADWSVRPDGRLYLTSVIVNPCSSKDPVPLNVLFPQAQGPVEATWYSGPLEVIREPLNFKEKPRVLQVEKGRVVGAPGSLLQFQSPATPPLTRNPPQTR